jgi:hypothetical protein
MRTRVRAAVVAALASTCVLPTDAGAVLLDYTFVSTPPYSVTCRLRFSDSVSTSGSKRNILWNQRLSCNKPLGRAYIYGDLEKLNLNGTYSQIQDDTPEECFLSTSPLCAQNALGQGDQALSQVPGSYRNEAIIHLVLPGSAAEDPWVFQPGCHVYSNGTAMTCNVGAEVLAP